MDNRINIRLSRIEQLPAELGPAVAAIWDDAKAMRASQQTMLTTLNLRLAEADQKPVTRSSFNRWVQRVRSGEIARPTLAEFSALARGESLTFSQETANLILNAAESIRRDLTANR